MKGVCLISTCIIGWKTFEDVFMGCNRNKMLEKKQENNLVWKGYHKTNFKKCLVIVSRSQAVSENLSAIDELLNIIPVLIP